ncbi:DedA family protein [Arthrobacter zhaoguopingii]|uniref:DedA family protein n=1 Tax=Arthrobacter zhaoguopingii TaxID=2681491 RepID=UPI0013597741|nr:VTT domain-containing protein [Arthrobacter zhaoguopingii]
MEIPGPDLAMPLYFLLMFTIIVVDVILPIVPSELMVIAAGTMASHGNLFLPAAVLVATTGSWVGDLALFVLFRRRLTHWLDRFRWGRSVHGGLRRAVEKAGKSPTYAGLVAVRFLPGGRTASVAAAGIAEVALRPFMVLTALGACLWAAWLLGLGYLTGASTGLPLWVSVVLGTAVGTLVGLVTAAVLGLRQRRRARAAGAGETGGTAGADSP